MRKCITASMKMPYKGSNLGLKMATKYRCTSYNYLTYNLLTQHQSHHQVDGSFIGYVGAVHDFRWFDW